MITHPEKVLFPDDEITKGEVAAYYEMVAETILPHIRGRPVTMERYPAGIGAKGFLQKNVVKGFPPWLRRVEAAKSDGVVNYPLANDARSLLWMANQNCITPHVWASREPELFYPDICVFDLDPSEDDAKALRAAVLAVRDVLAELGLDAWLKTSGSKGFHIVVPLDGKANFEDIAAFAHAIGALLVKRHPDRLTQEFSKADRGGRIFVDTDRNSWGATHAAPYAVRARPGAPVSAPCSWAELASVTPSTFTLRGMEKRLADVGDLWKEMLTNRLSLDDARKRLAGNVTEDEVDEAEKARRRRPGPRRKAD